MNSIEMEKRDPTTLRVMCECDIQLWDGHYSNVLCSRSVWKNDFKGSFSFEKKKKKITFFHMYFSVSLTPLWSKLVRAVWNWTFLLHLIDETTPNVLYTGGIRSWKNPANVKELENSQFQVRKKWLWEVMEICITNPRMCFRWHRLRGRYSGSFYSYFSCRHVIIIIIIRFEQYKWTPCAINDSYTSMYAAERNRNYTLASGKI